MPPSPILLLLLLAAYAHGGINADPTPTEPPDPRSKSIILVKVWSSIIFFVATFLARVSPHLLKRNERLIQVGAQFAGGVFLGTALLQFLSDSDQAFEHLKAKDKYDYYYPFAFLLASVGYLLTLLVDCIVLWVHRKQRRRSDGVTARLQGAIQQRKSISSIGTSQSQIPVDDATDQFTKALFVKATSFIDSVLLIILFCFQSVFQGISIGVTTTQNRVWRALWTVTLHKVFVAIAMGLSFLRTIPEPPLLSCIAYAFALAISCPVGVAIGIVIDATSPGIALDWIYAVFMGLASGVLVYVSVNHILSEGYLPQGRVSVDAPHHKFLAVLLGIAAVAVVMIWDTSNRAYGGG